MSTKSALEKFAKQVVKESKTALTKKKKNTSKKLYDSLGYDLNVSPNSFRLSFTMEDYGEFIDKGVKGNKSSAKAPKSPYSYKSKMPPTKSLDKWIVKKGIAPKDKKGKFISRESLKFAIAKNIQMYGIETTNFFTKPFESAFKSLPDDLLNDFGLDIDNMLR